MKKQTITTSIFISFFIGMGLSAGIQITPENTEIVSDLDEVMLQSLRSIFQKINIVGGGIWRDPLHAASYLEALYDLKNLYQKDADGDKEALYDSEGNPIHGLTFHFLFHGMRDPRLTQHAVDIVNTIEQSRIYIEGTKEIYIYLKEQKGYRISYATNKDRISYDVAAKKFGTEFTNLPTTVFVAHHGNHPHTIARLQEFAHTKCRSKKYKNMLTKALTIQPSGNIHHVPAAKPHIQYYAYVHQTLGTSKNIIFIDDKKSNINGFNQLQKYTQAQLYGIHFKNPVQLADEFVRLGVLSEKKDKKFLKKIRRSSYKK